MGALDQPLSHLDPTEPHIQRLRALAATALRADLPAELTLHDDGAITPTTDPTALKPANDTIDDSGLQADDDSDK